jgi:hypothetical protein
VHRLCVDDDVNKKLNLSLSLINDYSLKARRPKDISTYTICCSVNSEFLINYE